MAIDRQRAHFLLDKLGPSQLSAVLHLMETMVPAVEGHQGLSDEERQAVAEVDELLRHNQPIVREEVLAEFGLNTADWKKAD